MLPCEQWSLQAGRVRPGETTARRVLLCKTPPLTLLVLFSNPWTDCLILPILQGFPKTKVSFFYHLLRRTEGKSCQRKVREIMRNGFIFHIRWRRERLVQFFLKSVFVSFGPVYRLHDELFIVGTNAGI